MFEEEELSSFSAGAVISPVVAQMLPGGYPLVAGGEKAARLAEVLGARYVVAMGNGELSQRGLLSRVIETEGSEEEFARLLLLRERERTPSFSIELVKAPAGQTVCLPI
jgi:hypothetical protein